MNILKMFVLTVCSIALFGLIGGFDPSNTVGMVLVKSLIVGAVDFVILGFQQLKYNLSKA